MKLSIRQCEAQKAVEPEKEVEVWLEQRPDGTVWLLARNNEMLPGSTYVLLQIFADGTSSLTSYVGQGLGLKLDSDWKLACK